MALVIDPLSRRAFLQRTAAVAGGVLLSGRRAVAASDKLVVAHIGVGGMGNAHVRWFSNFPDVETAAVCDCDSARATETLKRLQTWRPETKAVAETDFRRLLDRDDIDIITTATPDHWHALIGMLAIQAGKDVYGEKPLSHHYREGVKLAELCARYDRRFQLGTQIHAGENYHRVVELVRSGALGKIHTVRLWKEGGTPGMGFPADAPPPETLDWDMWLGPAPDRPYNPAYCPRSFRYFWDYSGGVFADFWCHIADLFCWALQPGAPKSVEAHGGVPNDGIAETPTRVDATFEYEDVNVFWTSRVPNVPGAAGRGIGCQFVGDDGSLVADYSSCVIFLNGETLTDLPDVPRTLPRSPGHQRNFVDCVKSREQAESNVDYALMLTTPLHLALLSFRLGRKLVWDDLRGQVVGDEVANRMLDVTYRRPWTMPV